MSEPRPAEFFVRGTALGLLRRRHPYDFQETYELLQAAYGYRSRFVNLGHWRPELVPGSEELDPGERLVALLIERCGAGDARLVVDVGAGLGEGAAMLARRYPAARVVGVNVNERQIAFARALARARGFSDRVDHVRADACTELSRIVEDGTVDAVFAVECVGHLRAPTRFLADVRTVLRPGGTFVCCMNVAARALPLSLRATLRATYGFVPRPASWWLEAMDEVGLTVIDQGDLTTPVLLDGARAVRARLRLSEVRAAVPWLAWRLVHLQLAAAYEAAAGGSLAYAYVVARA